MKRPSWLVLAGPVFLLSALAGCGESTGVAGGPEPAGLEGDFVSDSPPDPPFGLGAEPIRLTLRAGAISFTAGCNHFSGQATWDDGVLRARNLGGTEMGCPSARQAQDEWMVEFFGSSPEIVLDGTALIVRSRSAEVAFVTADDHR